jgi:hypothetical protein
VIRAGARTLTGFLLGAEHLVTLRCFQCGRDNDEASFCSSCGSPLSLADYITKTLNEQLATKLRDREVLEAESAHNVFAKVVGWFKVFAIVLTLAIAIVGAGGIWKFTDWSSSVDKAKQDVLNTAAEIKKTAEQTKQNMAGEAAALKQGVESSRTELQAASQLVPEVESLRRQLGQATSELQAQPKIISSSENFVKEVFSSHVAVIFHIGPSLLGERYAVLMPPPGGDQTVVVLLLESSPIPATLQLQYHVYAQPPNSYFSLHNIVIYVWGQSLDALRQQQLSVSYFPNKSDKDLIKSLSMREGRIFADDEPLPKFNQPDPDFKGDKWIDQQSHFKN